MAFLFTAFLSACSPSTPPTSIGSRPTGIVVASFNFPESELLADIYAGALRAHGYRVTVQGDVGPREIVDAALASGLVDFVPEYSGSALLFFDLGQQPGRADIWATHDALARVLVPHGLVPLDPAPAQDANAVVVTSETAARYGLRTVSDLARVAGRMTFGGPPECPQRLLCLKGLRDVYGLRFQQFAGLDSGGPLTLQALLAREIDAALLFTTDPAITSDHLVVLADDRRLQPAENVTPVIRRAVLTSQGIALQQLVDRVSARLTTTVVRGLDARLAQGVSPRPIAEQWLVSEGIA